MREGKKERGAPRHEDSRDSQSFHGLVYFKNFIYTKARAWALPTLRLAFVFLIPRRLALFGGLARLSSMLVLYGTYRAHERRMKSAGVEGLYVCSDGRC